MTILHIDSSISGDESVTRRLTGDVAAQPARGDEAIIYRDLAAEPARAFYRARPGPASAR